jgi:hypothetical protein
MRYIRRVWSPLILGSMIIMIGLTVVQVGLGPARFRRFRCEGQRERQLLSMNRVVNLRHPTERLEVSRWLPVSSRVATTSRRSWRVRILTKP